MVYQPQKEVCFKSPCPEKLLLFSGRRRVGLSPEDCRKRMCLAPSMGLIVLHSRSNSFRVHSSMKAIVHRTARVNAHQRSEHRLAAVQ
jgi:hypothetical protein